MRYLFILLCLTTVGAYAQGSLQNDSKQQYLNELKQKGKKFTTEFYPNYVKIYQLPEQSFISKIDSARDQFSATLMRHKNNLDDDFVKEQQIEIKYYFDRLLIEYPINNDIYLAKSTAGSSGILNSLKANISNFNDPRFLKNSDFIAYVKSFLSLQTYLALKKDNSIDNKHLQIVWRLIPRFFKHKQCADFWRSEYLFNHIDNNGIKNIEKIYADFNSTCRDTAYLKRVNTIYNEDLAGRRGHLIKAYKNIGQSSLDLHIFLPDNRSKDVKLPVILYFHGGSWSEGKPDWFFYGCENQAKKGWVAIAVEYRTYSRFGTLPFEAVMDAKSAIRWIREHAEEFSIDTNKVVVSGNSAGGHLCLATALANQWNEKTDNLQFSAVPNAIMVNAGVYDLTDQSTMWISKDLKDKDLVKQISPNHLVRRNFPKTLLIHGTSDKNVAYATAKTFQEKMKEIGNDNIQFETLNDAEHFIWYHPKFSVLVTKLRNEFLAKLAY